MKHRLYLLIIIFLIAIIFSISFTLNTITIYATGESNVDGGGGGMGSGIGKNTWSPGNDGVRVTVVDAETGSPVSKSIDYANKEQSKKIINFGTKSKLHYINGSSLNPTNEYENIIPNEVLPRIISTNGTTNIAAIKSYFTDEQVIKRIANEIGTSLETLTNGKYKLLIEPIAYFKFDGIDVGMTAHEAALYDQLLSAGLRSKMISLSHQNLPLAMFLERSDLGLPAYNGARNKPVSNETILSSLGMGIVRFNEKITPEPDRTDVEYRINTEVITSVILHTFDEINPDDPATVTFKINGGTYKVSNIVIPAGESQVVWAKWRTPSTEQNIDISISTDKGYLDNNHISAKIVDLDKSIPPNPTANDRNDSFKQSPLPNKEERTSASWGVWRAQWHEEADDKGWYKFFFDIYTANLSVINTIKPDDKSPTSVGKQMKSGYGINNKVNASIKSNAPNSHITGAQTGISCFPEFGYETYWRLLDLTTPGYNTVLEFKNNIYSTYNNRTHFTPVWYPDSEYKVYTYIIDAWTPAGMLCMNLSDSVYIKGSVYDDWHVKPAK